MECVGNLTCIREILSKEIFYRENIYRICILNVHRVEGKKSTRWLWNAKFSERKCI